MTTRQEIERALALAQQAGCTFVVEFQGPIGCHSERLSPADLAACILDGINIPARMSGLSSDEYAEWIEQGGHVRCSSTTHAGKQCRNSASRKPLTDPAAWLSLRATAPYCPTHGG